MLTVNVNSMGGFSAQSNFCPFLFMKLLDYWLPIPGYFGKYDASFSGKIRRNETREFKKYHIEEDGYWCVNMPPKGKRRVHRLIAMTFIPNPENKPEVNHKDGNKLNACANNFEWATKAENRKHAEETGLYRLAIRPTQEQLVFIKEFKYSLTLSELVDRLTLPRHAVSKAMGVVGVRRRKTILNFNTGIFYDSVELSTMLGISVKEVIRLLNEERKPNTTPFRYV